MEFRSSARGLTSAEAARLRDMGQGNVPPPPITRSTGQIIRENVCTLFNLFNVLIALALAWVGAWSNLLFILIIALNTVIGIVQELRAKRQVEQIAVLTAPRARVLRDGALRELPVEELVLGDVISLESGRQIPADAKLLSGQVEVDESRVLVQDLFSLESLAHVDVLCLDKTGTLTEGNMRVERLVPLTGDPPIPLETWMGAFLAHSDDSNATFRAMRAYFPDGGELAPIAKIPFSSQRKWSAMTFPELGTLVVGAPERMTGTEIPETLQNELRQGKRVLFLACTQETVQPDTPLPPMTALAALVLSAPVRTGAAETLAYLQREGVAVKVLSGDHPAAAAAVAARAGLPGASAWVDMSRVGTGEELARAAARYTVFGRVSPEQKRELVRAFQAQGHRVAMTGDGVNDILAMRKADCSIAMAHGSEAARQAAQVVLLDDDFTVLPQILMEGRRVVNNMTRVAGVFFVKTIYSILLSLFCVLANLPFPLIPIQVTLIDLFIEGYPAFFQSFVADGRKIQGRFLPSVLRRALPNAAAILLAAAGLLLGGGTLGLPAGQVPMALYLVIGVVEAEALLKSCLPMDRLRGFLFLTASAGFFCAVLLSIRSWRCRRSSRPRSRWSCWCPLSPSWRNGCAPWGWTSSAARGPWMFSPWDPPVPEQKQLSARGLLERLRAGFLRFVKI